MARTGEGRIDWAAKLRASLAGTESRAAGAKPAPTEPAPPPPTPLAIEASEEAAAPAPPAEVSAEPAEEAAPAQASIPAEPEPQPAETAGTPPTPAPPPAELEAAEPPPAEPQPDPVAELPSSFSLLLALAAGPTEPATTLPAALPDTAEAAIGSEAAEPPMPVLFNAIAAPAEEPRPASPSGYALLDLASPPARNAAPAPGPAREAPRLTLLEALPRPEALEATPAPLPLLEQVPSQAGPLRPSPLLDAIRTAPPETPKPTAEPATTAEPAAPLAPSAAAMQAEQAPRTLPEREVRAVFELLVGRPPRPTELDGLQGFTRRMALRDAIMAGDAFRDAVLAPAAAPTPAPPEVTLAAEDLARLDTLGAGASAEPGMVVDWFGLRTPAAIAPELAAHAGKVLPKPYPADPRASAAEWVGLARSTAEAKGSWRALSVGGERGDLLLAGAVAARRRGLDLELHVAEPVPGTFAALQQHADANGIEPGARRFQQARIGTDPERRPARGVVVQDLLAGAETWDWLRISQPKSLGPLLKLSAPLLTERVRVLSLVTRSRSEEALAIRTLAQASWRLVAELPVRLAPANPTEAQRPGAQVWLGKLA